MEKSPSNSSETVGERTSVFRQLRGETLVILGIWLGFMAWTIGVTAYLGYAEPAGETVELVWGLPAWVFWGIVVPWAAANVTTFWFCLGYMKDQPLDEPETPER